MPPIYGLTPRRAVQVKQLCEDGGSTAGGSPLPTAARGPTWVKVTGSPTAGWHPAVVSLDQAGTFTDLTDAVKVAAADGSTLTTGRRYPCTRTGDDTGGIARFRTLPDSAGGAFLAQLTTTSGGLWKWYRVVNDVTSGTEAATFNAKPAKIDGSVLLNPVTGLRVWMWASGGSTPYDFLPVGYAASGFGGLLSAAAQTISGDKTLENYLTVNSTKFPNAVPGGTGEKVTFRAWAAQLGGDAVAALQVVDTYVSSALSRRALYAFREVWDGTYSTTYQGVRVGGYLAAKGENVGSSAFVAVRTALGGGLMCRSYESSGTESAAADAAVGGWGYVWWNPMPMEVYTGASGIGYAFLGQLRAVGRPNGSAATFDKTAELNLFILNKPTAAGTPNTIAGQYLFLENRDSGVPTRYAAPDGFAVADLDVNGRITDGVSGTTPGGDTVQGGIITAIGTAPTVPAPPTTNGTYTLTCTVSGGVPTLAWV